MIDTDSFNVLVLGNAGVGKSHMYQEYTGSRDALFTPATVCLEVHAKSLRVRGRVVDVCIFDATGDAGARLGLRGMLRRLFEGGENLQAVNLHCDANQPQSIDAMVDWARWLHATCSPQPGERELGSGGGLEDMPVFITASMHVNEKSRDRIVAHLLGKHGIPASDALICFAAEDYRMADALDDTLAKATSYRRQQHRCFLPLKSFLR